MKILSEVFPEHCRDLVTADITEMLYDILQKDQLHYLKPEIFNLIKHHIHDFNWLDQNAEHSIALSPAVIFKAHDISDYLLDNAYDLSQYNHNLSMAITSIVQPHNFDYFMKTMQREELHINYFIDASVKVVKSYTMRNDFFHEFYHHVMASEKLESHVELFLSTLLKNISTYPKLLEKILKETSINSEVVIDAMEALIEKDNLQHSPKVAAYQKWKLYACLNSNLSPKTSQAKIKI